VILDCENEFTSENMRNLVVIWIDLVKYNRFCTNWGIMMIFLFVGSCRNWWWWFITYVDTNCVNKWKCEIGVIGCYLNLCMS